AIRAQAQATRPGVPGPDFDGLAAELRVVVERYPELRAQEGFTALERELTDTENRIALARAYYNDIATHYATRLEIIPDRWVAALRKLTPEPLLAATRFERAAVVVKLAE
ncbi:MAG: LemA family protein, partial [Burkholderiales bacterium]|nr:LemA family protein [Opitutaceae bacterium]